MKPIEFHTLATALAAQSAEAARRTAVSRAYYAALNRAAQYVQPRGPPLPTGCAFHKVVRDRLADDFAGASDQLEKLMAKRGDADYEVWQPWDDDVSEALEISANIIATIDAKG